MKKLTFLFILFFTSVNLYSQSGGWSWTHPKPQGGYVQNMKMIDANNWYAMCDYGVMMKTSNAGATWTTFSIGYQSTLYPGSGILQTLYSGWFFDVNNFILGSQSCRGVVRSTNGGITYDTVQVLATGSGTIYDFYFINAQTGFFCGTSTFKIQKTTNGGLNWSPVPYTGTTSLYSIHAPDTNNIIVTSTAGNTYFTTNAGVTWTTSNVGTTNTLNDSRWINAATGYVCGSSGCFRYTTNFGANWTGTNPPTTSTMNRVVVNGTDVYVAGFDNSMNMYKTTDNGTTWTSIPYSAAGQFYNFNTYAFDMIGSTMLVAGTFGLMNKSTNSGANWQTASSHVTIANMVDIYAASGNGRVIAIGTDIGANDCAVYSTNGGNTWVNTGAVSNTNMSDLSMRNSNTGYVVGRFGLFWKTTNGGVSWDTTRSNNPALTPFFCNGVDFIDDNTGWIAGGLAGVGGNTKIWKTTNGGVNWTEQTQNYVGPVGVKIEFLDANTGYTCGVNQVQKTTNGGDNWSLVTTGLPNTSWNSLVVLDVNNVFISSSSSSIYATSDGGANWTNLNFPLTNIGTLFCTDWVNANTGMVAGIFGTVGRTTNKGATWELSRTGGYTTMGIDMVHADTAFAVCGNTPSGEIFKYVRSITGTITWNNEVPKDYSLEQNYPNPFNPLTKIKFSLPNAGTVTLKVFDIAGREVSTIISGLYMNRGIVTYDFDGSELSSGVYFYSLLVDNSMIDTKKMVLVK